jgi:hypothetical protein
MTLALLFVTVAPDDAEPKNLGEPRVSPRATVGNVTSADPSDAVFDVFVMTNLTPPVLAPYAVFVQSV